MECKMVLRFKMCTAGGTYTFISNMATATGEWEGWVREGAKVGVNYIKGKREGCNICVWRHNFSLFIITVKLQPAS